MIEKETSSPGHEGSTLFSCGKPKLVLVADIGATHCRFALFSLPEASAKSPDIPEILCWQILPSGSLQDGNALLEAMRDWVLTVSQDQNPTHAVLALAGPVIGNSCMITNLGWEINTHQAQQSLGIRKILLINDFVAQGFATQLPDHLQLATIQSGKKTFSYPSALLGAGTGCGKAILLPTTPFTVLPSEGGQADFPCVSPFESSLAAFILKNTGKSKLTVDLVLSGSGLAHLLHYITGQKKEPLEATKAISQEPRVLSFFATLYARVCRNFVLETMSRGGLYITGGIAAHLPVLHDKNFLTEFHNGPQWLTDIPIYHLQHKLSGLWGAALYAAHQHSFSSSC